MPLDSHSPTPVFQQIADHVRRSVAAGVYRAGEAIPSLRQMALDLVVNPNTVQRAYEELEREGLIEAKKGLGMFVTRNGVTGARKRSEEAVYGTFISGIRAGHAASMTADHIRATYEQAERDIAAEAKDPPTRPADKAPPTGDQP